MKKQAIKKTSKVALAAGLSMMMAGTICLNDFTNTYAANLTSLSSGTLSAPTGLASTSPSSSSASDGTITGVTTAMEYRLSTETTYHAVTGTTITGLAAGTYEVRYQASEGVEASEATEVVVSYAKATQKAPTGLSSTAASSATASDGTITGVSTAMEYRKKGTTEYAAITDTTVTSLVAGTYEVRYAATDSQEASDPTEVVVGNAKSSLSLTVPTFTALTVGYGEQSAQALQIVSASDGSTAITSITSSNTSAFTLAGSGSEIDSLATLSSYTLQVNTGLSEGTYTTTITLTYDDGKSVSAQATVTIVAAGASSLSSSDSGTSSQTTAHSGNMPGQRTGNQATGLLKRTNATFAQMMRKKTSTTTSGYTTIDSDTGNPEDVDVTDKTISSSRTIDYGDGTIKIVIDNETGWSISLKSTQRLIDAALSDSQKLKVANGKTVYIRVTITLNEGMTSTSKSEIKKALSSLSQGKVGDYVNVTVAKKYSGGTYSTIEETRRNFSMIITIPDSYSTTSSYYGVQLVDSTASFLEDIDSKNATFTFSVGNTGTYALCYTVKATSVAKTSCYWHFGGLAILAAYIASCFLIDQERKRQIKWYLLGGTITLLLVTAILGSCVFDWPIAIVGSLVAALFEPVRNYVIYEW